MQVLVDGLALAGSMVTAFVLQRAILEAWLRAMHHQAAASPASEPNLRER